MHQAQPLLNQRRVAPLVNDDHRRAEVAYRKVQLREVSRARQRLRSTEMQSKRPRKVLRVGFRARVTARS